MSEATEYFDVHSKPEMVEAINEMPFPKHIKDWLLMISDKDWQLSADHAFSYIEGGAGISG